jgi:GNAT superfamily N-acetyltransferase
VSGQKCGRPEVGAARSGGGQKWGGQKWGGQKWGGQKWGGRKCGRPEVWAAGSARVSVWRAGLVSEKDDRIRIRKARIGDEPGLAALDTSAWTHESGFPSVIQAADGSFFSPDSPPDAHLVAELGGQLAGYLRLKPMTRLPENVHVLGILGLAVAPTARRKGIAAALLKAAEDQVRARGATKLSQRVLSPTIPPSGCMSGWGSSGKACCATSSSSMTGTWTTC